MMLFTDLLEFKVSFPYLGDRSDPDWLGQRDWLGQQLASNEIKEGHWSGTCRSTTPAKLLKTAKRIQLFPFTYKRYPSPDWHFVPMKDHLPNIVLRRTQKSFISYSSICIGHSEWLGLCCSHDADNWWQIWTKKVNAGQPTTTRMRHNSRTCGRWNNVTV